MTTEKRKGNVAVLFSLLAVLYLFNGLRSLSFGNLDNFRFFVLISLGLMVVAFGAYQGGKIFYRIGIFVNFIGILAAILSLIFLSYKDYWTLSLALILVSLISYVITTINFYELIAGSKEDKTKIKTKVRIKRKR